MELKKFCQFYLCVSGARARTHTLRQFVFHGNEWIMIIHAVDMQASICVSRLWFSLFYFYFQKRRRVKRVRERTKGNSRRMTLPLSSSIQSFNHKRTSLHSVDIVFIVQRKRNDLTDSSFSNF